MFTESVHTKNLTAEFLSTQVVPLMPQAMTLERRVDPEKWAGAAGFDGLLNGNAMEARIARVYVGAARDTLYVAAVTAMRPGDGFQPGDGLEIWVRPHPAEATGTVYRLKIDPQGRVTRTAGRRGEPLPADGQLDTDCRVTSEVHEGFWHCQAEIPARLFGRRDTAGRDWSLNVVRLFQQPEAHASLSGGRGPADEGLPFRFTGEPCTAVQFRHLGNPFDGDIRMRLTLFNPGTQAVDLSTRFLFLPLKGTDMGDGSLIRLAPGEKRDVSLTIEAVAANNFTVGVLVKEAAGRSLYSRCGQYTRILGNGWDAPVAPRPPLDFRFAYYPYQDRMRIRAEVPGLPASASPQRVDFTVRPAGGGAPVKQFTFEARAFSNGVAEADFRLPALCGEYEIVATPAGGSVPMAPVSKKFERTVFEWEHNTLGKSRTVYPPFTPIEADGRTLRTVLKEYVANGVGLLDRIRTENPDNGSVEEILDAPMRYAATVDGREITARDGAITTESAEPDQVVTRTRFALGPVQAESVSTLDYDGMLRVDLTIHPDRGHTLDRLDLEIPLRNAVATMMHAVSIRYRDAVEFRRLPQGEGAIWSAADLPPVGGDENFCNYIFLGDASRGLCWFTEGDRGWSRAPGQPNLDIIRRGSELLLRVHLVGAPVALETPRTITFGLMAAPAKPRLAGWRHRWYTDKFNVLGCDHHWGAVGCCGSFYPIGKDLTFWEALKRANRQVMSDEEIESVLTRFTKNYARYGQGAAAGFAGLGRRNLRNRYGKRMIFYYNRSSFSDCDEFQTFMDEWCRNDYNDEHRGQRLAWEVMAVPSESFLDYSLFWYAKSFDVAGNTGIYMDNIFFAPSSNTAMTGAYRREDGSIGRSTGIWELREQAKRTFVFMNERGMEPIHMAHMTSLDILPILSFYTVQYDWEWQRGRGAVHTRFSREYLQLVSNGEHPGTWPIVLHEQGELERDPWTLKTFLGVTIVHEIIVDPYTWHGRPIDAQDVDENKLFDTFRQPILDLVQKPGCAVYRYWDARPQPVKAADPDLPGIVFVRKGVETIFAITSYAANERIAKISIDAAALGFEGGCRVLDMETGLEVPADGGKLVVPIPSHDLREFRIVPKA